VNADDAARDTGITDVSRSCEGALTQIGDGLGQVGSQETFFCFSVGLRNE
jgi:hypothetical protein